MEWERGFTGRFYGAIVNPDTWNDETLINISGGSIKLTDSGLRESADLECDLYQSDSEQWVRVYLDARQTAGNELIPLFTGLTQIPNVAWNGNRKNSNVQCYSVLKPANDVLLPLGWYILGGTNGAKAVRDLLKEVVYAPIVIEGLSGNLSSTLVAESGETILSMVDYILDSIDWRLRIEGDGTIVICDKAYGYSEFFNADTYDILEMDVTVENNWYDCPNVFRAIEGDMMAIARDSDPDSKFSIQNRGREIWMEEQVSNLEEGESLAQYASRRLRQEQQIQNKLSYNRRFHPDIRPTDLVKIKYPYQDIDGVYEVISQTITLGNGATVSEEVEGTG